MTFHLHRRRLVFFTVLWEAAFLILSASQFNSFQLLNIFGFLTLIVLPGLLTMIILRLDTVPFWAYVGLVIGFSLLELMAVTLVGNTFLPYVDLGIARPLDQPALLMEFTVLVNTLLAVCWEFTEDVAITVRRFVMFDTLRDALFALFPLLFVILSVAGAIRLNNGTDGMLTLIMLIGLGLYSGILVWQSKKLGENVLPTALFFMALALLLMTSLRGWHITGHDIQREYFVFLLSKSGGIWSIEQYRNAYNACMSITILPTIFSNLLKISDPYIYKVLFQIIFATVPAVLYVLLRRYVAAAVALLSTLYFMFFPTFFTDMPFLNRQEVAFIFLVLMTYIIFDDALPLPVRRAVFLLFGLGMVFSHYSTTYTVVLLLLFVVCARALVQWIAPRLQRIRLFSDSAIAALHATGRRAIKPLITVWMVMVLACASFLWSSIVTDTASNSIGATVMAVFATMRSNVKEDAQSTDVSASIFSYRRPDIVALFRNYETKVVIPSRAENVSGYYYGIKTYAKYPVAIAPDTTIPVTKLGTMLSLAGINMSALNYILRQVFAKLLQVLVVIGFLSILYSRRFVDKIFDTEFVLLMTGSFIMLATIVIIPLLSLQYGLLRAFQQSLIFLGVLVAIGSLALVVRAAYTTRLLVATALVLVFLLSEAGVLTQVFGGYVPQLHLNNDGPNYDLYYLRGTEIAGVEWLASQVKQHGSQIQAQMHNDRYSANTLTAITSQNPLSDIYPGLVRRDSYVYLGYETVHKQRATINYNGTRINYFYPLQFLDDNKDLVYSNADARVYR